MKRVRRFVLDGASQLDITFCKGAKPTPRCPDCRKFARHQDGCARVECPMRRPVTAKPNSGRDR